MQQPHYQQCPVEDEGLLCEEVSEGGVEELDQLCGHIPQDVELWVEGGHVGGKASLYHGPTHVATQFGNRLLAFGARLFEQSHDALVGRGDFGYEGPRNVLHLCVDGEQTSGDVA